ncbi:MAG: T9SS type A sorting domain-containing protein, partial [Candidatus Kapabacteria bacterium]|nr:T9SS type A sorting domain-containing protein [Candidatus Kapabacteria bacterium]
AYDVREIRDASYMWSAIGGTLQTNPTLATAIVKWNESDTAGTLVLTRTFPGGCKDETRIAVTLPVLVSVDEPRDDDAASFDSPRVMPNPANDLVRLMVPMSASVEIVDIHGRSVLVRDVASGTHDVDVSALAQGTYYVRFIMPMATHVAALTIRR